ncbi:uncharacterized protein LOC110029119 [Phalaenopsis equestris]|uniref:uncharacterized protein LOC110029119 n=1 Tax=Phalaenopsis equestris TaxID=78828 RepID=UPI0009E3ADCA|nr:uncharacterized protein LOC110029119 [Phalaenopsis equestris]
MGNCSASKLGGGKEEPVSLCRERKRLLKASVKRRQVLAEAHERYIHSIHAVAGALNLFVARHSSPSPVVVSIPSSSSPSSSSNPSFLRQTPTEPKTEALAYRFSVSSSTSSTPSSNLREEREREEYFFAEIPVAPPSETEVYGWDFFNPFEGLTAAVMTAGLDRSSDEELRVMREREGIPELEEEVHEANREVKPMTVAVEVKEKREKVAKMVESEEGDVGERKEKELTVMEVTERKMELLDALKDVEEEFLKAYDSGKELARMLGADIVDTNPGEDEIKDNSSKLIQAIKWHRSSSSLSSSSRRYLVCKHSSLTESRSVIFEDYGGMGAGSHWLTLGRLYAWEKKLYEEVKAGDQTRQMYQKKCLQLRNLDAKGSGTHTLDKSRAAVKDLYARIWVSLRTIETISIRIHKVIDDELHPQLTELLQGMMRTWRSMLQSHERQKQIMSEVKAFTCPSYGRYCSDSQHQVTRKLEEQLENWRTCFKNYVSAQRSYVEALEGWHSKFCLPEYPKTRYLASSYREGSPPLLSILQEWLRSSMKLPDRPVILSMKGFINNVRILLVKQGEEQQQKRKVDSLAKEFDQRISALQKTENRIMELKLLDVKPEPEVGDRVEYLSGRKNLVDMFRQKLDLEKTKHRKCMQETTEATLNGFKIGLGHVFESLTDFSQQSLKFYTELLERNGTVKEKTSGIEDSKVGVDIR